MKISISKPFLSFKIILYNILCISHEPKPSFLVKTERPLFATVTEENKYPIFKVFLGKIFIIQIKGDKILKFLVFSSK